MFRPNASPRRPRLALPPRSASRYPASIHRAHNGEPLPLRSGTYNGLIAPHGLQLERCAASPWSCVPHTAVPTLNGRMDRLSRCRDARSDE